MIPLHKIFNFLPSFKGKLRLAGLLFFKTKERTFRTPNQITFTVPNLQENVSFELFINGVYERETIEFICNSIPENGTLIDVGANIGAICLEIATVRPDIRIYAFEASPRVFNYLKKNQIQNNLKNLFVYNLAVHVQDGIELPFYSPSNANGKGSFSPVFTDVPEFVRTVRLDSFFHKENIFPDFIKCDVEGYELLVFQSFSGFKAMDKVILLFEFVDWAEDLANFKKGAAQSYLLEQGYELLSLTTNENISTAIDFGDHMITAKKLTNNQ